MSSGTTHDRVNTLATLGVMGLSVVTANPNIALCGLGLAVGTIWLSPDLDLSRSNPTNRLGPLKLLWKPYIALCGHHRSIWSHSPLLSTVIRLLYALTPLLIYGFVSGQMTPINTIVRSESFIYFLLGLEIATDLHLFLDWQYSLRRRLR
jgi:uncharacterized metal-binding protein